MTEEFFMRVLITLLDCGVKSVFVLGGAWLVTLLVRQSAAMRHLVWQTAFIVLLFLPLLSCFMPSSGSAYAAYTVSGAVNGLPLPVTMRSQEGLMSSVALQQELTSDAFNSPLHETSTAHASSLTALKLYLVKAIFVLWLSGVVIVILRSMIAYLAIINLRRGSMLGTHREVELSLISARVDLGRKWGLRTSTHARPSSAMTWGIFRPIILLPRCSLHWSEGLFEAVLLHELAHVQRYDSANQLLIESVCALYWWNPIVWICARAMRAEAERAADDLVLHCGVKASAYATELLRLAAAQAGYQQTVAGYGLSIVNGSPVEARIRSIIEANNHRRGTNLRESTAALSLGLLILLLFTSYRAIGLASNAKDSIAYAKQAMMSQEMFPANTDGHKIDFQNITERLSLSTHENGMNEIPVAKFITSDLKLTENQDDLRRKHESPASDFATLPADVSEGGSVQGSSDLQRTAGQSPDQVSRCSEEQAQKKREFNPDVIGGQNAKDGPSPRILDRANAESVQQGSSKKRGGDLISPDSPSTSGEEQRHRRQQLDLVNPDLSPDKSQPHPVKKGKSATRTGSPDVRPTSP